MAQQENEKTRSQKMAQVIMYKGFLAGVNACIQELEKKRESAEYFLEAARKDLEAVSEQQPYSPQTGERH